MNTPITDDAWYHNADHISAVDASLARRLETDRSALMEALETLTLVIGLTPIKGNLERLQEAQDLARAALSTARANFPQP